MTHQFQGIRLADGVSRGKEVEIVVDEKPVKAYLGETVASALIAAGHTVCQINKNHSYGVFCNIGICYNCLMKINGRIMRSCQVEVKAGMCIETRRFEKGSVS